MRKQVGEDVARLLDRLEQEDSPPGLRQRDSLRLLRQVFEHHYERGPQGIHWRDGPAVSNENRIVSPYDEEARSSRKRETIWLGYKVHLTETCDQDPERPHLIVQVQTERATTPDSTSVEPIVNQLREQERAPDTLLVDQGYMSATSLVEQARHGTVILGPVRESTSWQAQAAEGSALSDFELDWQQQRARCPQGHLSHRFQPFIDRHGTNKFEVHFPVKTCQQCSVRAQCMNGVRGRSLKILPQEEHQALEERRLEQATSEWKGAYALRAGVEGTISQAVRRTRLRRTPYRGEQKTHLHHVQVAAGFNVLRIVTSLQSQAQGHSSRAERLPSPFARLKEVASA